MQLKQAYLTADDPEGLARFYQSLGMSVRFTDAGKWVQFNSEATSFCIAGPSESVSEAACDAVLVFEVQDLEASISAARAAGGKVFGDIRNMGAHGRVAQVLDPSRNTIQFYQRAGG